MSSARRSWLAAPRRSAGSGFELDMRRHRIVQRPSLLEHLGDQERRVGSRRGAREVGDDLTEIAERRVVQVVRDLRARDLEPLGGGGDLPDPASAVRGAGAEPAAAPPLCRSPAGVAGAAPGGSGRRRAKRRRAPRFRVGGIGVAAVADEVAAAPASGAAVSGASSAARRRRSDRPAPRRLGLTARHHHARDAEQCQQADDDSRGGADRLRRQAGFRRQGTCDRRNDSGRRGRRRRRRRRRDHRRVTGNGEIRRAVCRRGIAHVRAAGVRQHHRAALLERPQRRRVAIPSRASGASDRRACRRPSDSAARDPSRAPSR